jgi:hypothetical protein
MRRHSSRLSASVEASAREAIARVRVPTPCPPAVDAPPAAAAVDDARRGRAAGIRANFT